MGNGCCSSQQDQELPVEFFVDNHLVEADERAIEGRQHRAFQNWSHQITAEPSITFVPKTKAGICNIVKWCKRTGKRVRACGYRHTFAPLYPDTGDVFISMLNLDDVEKLPVVREVPLDPNSDLAGIEVLKVSSNEKKALVRIGAATTNEQFRRWAVTNLELGNKSWTLPLNVIMVEITFGGSNATMSHGSGIRNATLSDLVREIEFVNANGDLQMVKKPEQLRAAAGSLGLLGIVTSLTLELDAMTFADFNPVVECLATAIPPPPPPPPPVSSQCKEQKRDNYKSEMLPTFVCDKIKSATPAELKDATVRFYQQCSQSYYAEWFWFVFTDQCFVNCWRNSDKPANGTPITYEFPSVLETKLEQYTSYVSNIIQNASDVLPAPLEEILFGKLAFAAMVQGATTKLSTPLINALHFRRGIQNMRVKNVEILIPIPATRSQQTDWSVCQRAWWDAILLVYEWKRQKKYPVRLAVEMRVLAGSNILLAPEFGHPFGTCSIEVVTTETTPTDQWEAFTQQLVDKWSCYTDAQGQALVIKPHWAKQWQHLCVHGAPIIDYLKRVNESNWTEFHQQLQGIAIDGKFNVSDLDMFSNQTLRALRRPVTPARGLT